MLALTRFEDKVNLEAIREEIGVTKFFIYKLRSKAISRGWMLGKIVEFEHVNDTFRLNKPKTFIAMAFFIVETVTKNSTTKDWFCFKIVFEINQKPGIKKVSISTVYKVLKEHSYGVFKRIVKLGFIVDNMIDRLK